jgi:transposase
VLWEGDVLEILKLKHEGHSQGFIAEKFNVSKSTISRIVRRKGWLHVGEMTGLLRWSLAAQVAKGRIAGRGPADL